MIILGIVGMSLYGYVVCDFLKENDFEKLCEMLEINSHKYLRKRQIECIVMLVILFFMPAYYRKYFLVLIYFVYKMPYFNLKKKVASLQKTLHLQFSIWLRLMEVLLTYHTVAQAIYHSIEAAPFLMKEPLRKLSDELREDPLNQSAYLGFMQDYEELYIERSMHHLYRYALLGSDEASNQLTTMIHNNAQTLIQSRQNLLDGHLNFYSWFGLVPMILVSLSFLGLMFLVLSNLMKGGWSA